MVFGLTTRPSLVLNDRLNISSKERIGISVDCQDPELHERVKEGRSEGTAEEPMMIVESVIGFLGRRLIHMKGPGDWGELRSLLVTPSPASLIRRDEGPTTNGNQSERLDGTEVLANTKITVHALLCLLVCVRKEEEGKMERMK